jgi:hypothetical protein
LLCLLAYQRPAGRDAPWQQRIDPVDRIALCDAGQNVREIGFRVQAIAARGLRDGVDAGCPHPPVSEPANKLQRAASGE